MVHFDISPCIAVIGTLLKVKRVLLVSLCGWAGHQSIEHSRIPINTRTIYSGRPNGRMFPMVSIEDSRYNGLDDLIRDNKNNRNNKNWSTVGFNTETGLCLRVWPDLWSNTPLLVQYNNKTRKKHKNPLISKKSILQKTTVVENISTKNIIGKKHQQ